MRNSRVVHGMEQKVKTAVPRFTAGIPGSHQDEKHRSPCRNLLPAILYVQTFSHFFGSVSAVILIAQLTITSKYVRVSFSHIYFVNFKFFSLI